MIFPGTLIQATLVRRYKRFLADVVLDDGEKLTVYCPNTGSMRSCSAPGSRVCLSESTNPKRKYRYTLEMVRVGDSWVGVNTALTNTLVAEAIAEGKIAELQGVDSIIREVKISSRSRLDLLLHKKGRKIYVEIKNCSLVENGVAMFPDAVTERGRKHLDDLAGLVKLGHEGVIFYLVQRTDASCFQPATHIDPAYAETLKSVSKAGVQIMVYQAELSTCEIRVSKALPFSFG